MWSNPRCAASCNEKTNWSAAWMKTCSGSSGLTPMSSSSLRRPVAKAIVFDPAALATSRACRMDARYPAWLKGFTVPREPRMETPPTMPSRGIHGPPGDPRPLRHGDSHPRPAGISPPCPGPPAPPPLSDGGGAGLIAASTHGQGQAGPGDQAHPCAALDANLTGRAGLQPHRGLDARPVGDVGIVPRRP